MFNSARARIVFRGFIRAGVRGGGGGGGGGAESAYKRETAAGAKGI